ncbi:MAG: amidase, partial [Chloroflexi bacterium]|nr:amidase [Chloroflexota bacterium]
PNVGSPERPYTLFVGLWLGTVLQDKMAEWREQIDPGLVRFLERNKERLAYEFVQAYIGLAEYWAGMQPFFERYDRLLTPTVAIPPIEIGQVGPREIEGVKVTPLGWMPFTYPFNITGQPAASVPCGWTDAGLPVGLQIVGRRFDDVTVLRAAAAFEQALPWADKRPSLD